MRLIDADALPYSSVQIYYGEDNTGKPIVVGGNAVVMSVAIKDAPTIDAAPVVHARWVHVGRMSLALPWTMRCSNCSCPSEYEHNFCPNCGRKMDAKEE